MSFENSSSVQIVCQKNSDTCESNYFLIYPQIDYPNFKLEILLQFSNSDINFTSFNFETKTLNPTYTIFMTVLKYLLLLVSVVTFAVYARFYSQLNPFLRTFEHKALFYLGGYLILFNDPLAIFALFWPNVAFSVISSFFYSMFLSGLIVFWSVMLRRIHREATTPETKLINNKFTIFIGSSLIDSRFFVRHFVRYLHDAFRADQERPFPAF